jgi:hypothetical protein
VRTAHRGGRRGAEEVAHLGHEGGPRSVVLERHMVAAFQQHEARARDHRGQLAAFVERHAGIAARMHHQRGHAHWPASALTSTL